MGEIFPNENYEQQEQARAQQGRDDCSTAIYVLSSWINYVGHPEVDWVSDRSLAFLGQHCNKL